MAAVSPALLHSLGTRVLAPSRARGLSFLALLDLPRGGVVEFATLAGLGHATRLGLWTCAAAQAESRAISHDGDCRWCGWIDPCGSLYAPAAAEAGIDLERLLVVRPGGKADDIAKIAVRMAASGVLAVLVIDRCGVPGARVTSKLRYPGAGVPHYWDIAVRRLALACESAGTTVLLLSELERAGARAPLPVAMRLEIARPSADRLSLRVVKDRRGIESGPRIVALSA